MLKPNSTVTTNLINARELIAEEKNWCQGSVESGHRHCVLGAINLVKTGSAYGLYKGPEWDALRRAAGEMDRLCCPVSVNNRLGHAAVMTMLDRAIAFSLQEAEAA